MTIFPKTLIALIAISNSHRVSAHLGKRHDDQHNDETIDHQIKPRTLLSDQSSKITWMGLLELTDHFSERNDRQEYNTTKDHKVIVAGKTYDNFDAWTESPEFKLSGATCHTRPPTKEEEIESKKVLEQFNETYDCSDIFNASYNPLCREKADYRELAAVTPIHIDTYFHVIRSTHRGVLKKADVDNSMKALNDAFAPDFVFVLKGWEITTNDDYYEASDYNDSYMKDALRKGDCSTLNIYSNDPYDELLGYAAFPNECKWRTTQDGVLINESTVPGGSSSKYNEGDTLVHEVGHWMGLFHTFEGGCWGGDKIADTPAESSPSSGCDLKRDTCPSSPGYDPVQNFMDYSPDACMNQFTAVQRAEMKAQWKKYRSNGSTPTNPPVWTPRPTPTPVWTPRPTPTPFTTASPTPSNTSPNSTSEGYFEEIFFNDFENGVPCGNFICRGNTRAWPQTCVNTHIRCETAYTGKTAMMLSSDGRAVSEPFTVSRYKKIAIHFWLRYENLNKRREEGLAIEYSPDASGSTFFRIAELMRGVDVKKNFIYYQSEHEFEVEPDVTDIRIRFRYIYGKFKQKGRIYIDDVRVSGLTKE